MRLLIPIALCAASPAHADFIDTTWAVVGFEGEKLGP